MTGSFEQKIPSY